MDKKEIREKLKNSLDMISIRFHLLIAGLLVLIEGVMVIYRVCFFVRPTSIRPFTDNILPIF